MRNGRSEAVALLAAIVGDCVDGHQPERHHVEAAVDAIIEAAVLAVQARLEDQHSEHAQAVAKLLRPALDLADVERAMGKFPPAGTPES